MSRLIKTGVTRCSPRRRRTRPAMAHLDIPVRQQGRKQATPNACAAREGDSSNTALPAMQGNALPRARVELLATGEIATRPGGVRRASRVGSGLSRERAPRRSLYLAHALLGALRHWALQQASAAAWLATGVSQGRTRSAWPAWGRRGRRASSRDLGSQNKMLRSKCTVARESSATAEAEARCLIPSQPFQASTCPLRLTAPHH